MIKKITFLFVALFASVAGFSQITFDETLFQELNFDIDFGDRNFEDKCYLHNEATDESDTIFKWEVLENNIAPDWEFTVCSGLLCVSNPTNAYDFTLASGDKLEFKLGYFFSDLDGNPIAGSSSGSIVAYSVKNPETVRDTLSIELVTRSHVSVEDIESKETFSVYPNPTKNTITVQMDNASAQELSIYDILGNLKQTVTVRSGDKIDVSDLASGVYILRINGSSYSRTIHKL